MATSTLKQLPKATAELEVIIPLSDIKTQYEQIVNKIVDSSEIPGFRKGKAPKKIVEEKIDKKKIYDEVIREIIPRVYGEEVKKHNLTPVASPSVQILKAKENEDWALKITIALKPKVNLKNYKEKIKELKTGNKPKIWTPGSETKKPEEKKPALDEVMKVILEEVEIELSDLLVNEEANRLLADLIDQTKKLGLTVEQYLLAKGKTSEGIRAEYRQQAQANLKIQFALLEIADTEKITVTPTDINSLLSKIEKPEEREKLGKDTYYLAHLIRQQKTIDFLTNL